MKIPIKSDEYGSELIQEKSHHSNVTFIEENNDKNAFRENYRHID